MNSITWKNFLYLNRDEITRIKGSLKAVRTVKGRPLCRSSSGSAEIMGHDGLHLVVPFDESECGRVLANGTTVGKVDANSSKGCG